MSGTNGLHAFGSHLGGRRHIGHHEGYGATGDTKGDYVINDASINFIY
jgi:hypothetical protein